MTKTIVIIGVTGNQTQSLTYPWGLSAAKTFLDIPGWKVRGLTRNPKSATSLALASQGVELVEGDLNNPQSILPVVKGATVVFANTAISDAMLNPASTDLQYLQPGQTIQNLVHELEVKHGKNIADAVATVQGLELFIWSSLSAAGKCSGGKYKGAWHFESKAKVVEYVKENHPKLAGRMSLVQMGAYWTNLKLGRVAVPWTKLEDGTLCLRVPGTGSRPIPFVDPTTAGAFVKALVFDLPAGTNLLAYSDRLAWADYAKLISKITGKKTVFEDCSVEEHAALLPGGYGNQVAEMHAYAREFGYEGPGDGPVVYAGDVKPKIEAGSFEEYLRGQDLSSLGM